MEIPPLRGFTVGVTADRRGEDQAVMLRRLDLDVVHAPVMATVRAPEEEALQAVTQQLSERPPDYLVANTGMGIRTWLGLAAGWGTADDLLGALASHTRVLARGPKAAGAVRSAGLELWWRAPDEQLASVGRRLLEEGMAGSRVAVQLHGDDRHPITSQLRAAGAEVVEIPVYRWAPPADQKPVLDLIEGCIAGRVDAVTFTAGPQVRNLMAVARRAGLAGDLAAAAGGHLLVACVGPVCAGVAAEEGLGEAAVPEHWRLGSLVRLVADRLAERRRVLHIGGREVVWQGSVAVVDGTEVRLDDRQRLALRCLAESGGVDGNGEREAVAALPWA